MYHSITFAELDGGPTLEWQEDEHGNVTDMHYVSELAGKNTWDDWHLVPASRPVFNPPSLKEHIVDIPGKDGVLDYTDALTGYPMFERREGTFEFIVMNGYQEWHELYSEIMKTLHGRTLRAVLEDDPEYYYEGRFMVQEWKSEKDYSRVIFAYKVDPYKWSILSSTQKSSYYTKTLTSTNMFTSIGFLPSTLGQAAAIPTIIVTGGTVDCDYRTNNDDGTAVSKTVRLTDGEHVMYDAPIREKTVLDGSGTTGFTFHWISGDSVKVSVDIRRGVL